MAQKPSSYPIESNLTDDPKIFLKYNSVLFCYHCNTKISITNASNHFIFTCTKSIAARKEKRKLALKQRRLAFNNNIKKNFKLDFFVGSQVILNLNRQRISIYVYIVVQLNKHAMNSWSKNKEPHYSSSNRL